MIDNDPLTVKSPFLETCDFAPEEFKPGPFTMVIFGGAGDLSKRKLIPTLYRLYKEKSIEEFSVLGFGLPAMSDDEYRDTAKQALVEFVGEDYDEKTCYDFCSHLLYQTADLGDLGAYTKLCEKVTLLSEKIGTDNLIYYLAVPPGVVITVIEMLSKQNLCREKWNSKIIVEKPFGRDRESAKKLNKRILRDFDENQIYRIDHYLGKETVQNLIFFRFGNSMFEPLWNRNYIDHVQITVAEDLGIENRASFYEKSGVIRDIVQNHIMQLIALVAMEPPVGFEADLIRDEKVKVLSAIRPMDEDYINENIVVAQYSGGKVNGVQVPGYREEEKVSDTSIVPTYFAGKFYLDNWRWAGVPFYVRTGKRLSKRMSEIAIEFKNPPLRILGRTCDVREPNLLVFNIQPHEETSLRFNVKYPGPGNRPYPVDMMFDYDDFFELGPHEAYERLLIDCMKGDLTLFARQDGVEAMWAVVDPIVASLENGNRKDLPVYTSGSNGPKEADALLFKEGRKWRGI